MANQIEKYFLPLRSDADITEAKGIYLVSLELSLVAFFASHFDFDSIVSEKAKTNHKVNEARIVYSIPGNFSYLSLIWKTNTTPIQIKGVIKSIYIDELGFFGTPYELSFFGTPF